MFINSLIIRSGGEDGKIIREIKFHKGVNLIVDKTSSSNKTETGNNVGKTTVLRLIDYCLNGKKEKIYQDPEFMGQGKATNKIKKFLEEKNICIELSLSPAFESQDKKVIVRNFGTHKNKIQKINGESLKDEEFKNKLKEICIGNTLEKPSFRQIICRNIRHDSISLSRTLKPLNYATNTEYELLYLFWLGIPYDSGKIKISSDLKFEKNHYEKMEKLEGSPSTLKQKLHLHEEDIKSLNAKRKKFNLNKSYTQDLESLNQVKKSINEMKTFVVSLTMKKNLIIESQQELDNTSENIEKEKIESIYFEAKKFIPKMQKRFEDVLKFHNQMLEEKKKFIGEKLPSINKELQNKEIEKNTLLKQEKELTEKLEKTGALEELEIIIGELTKKHERKGELEAIKQILEDSQFKINELNKKILEINKELGNQTELIEERITNFNQYFSKLCNKLYSQKFLLSTGADGKGNLTLKIDGLENNPGTGAKKVEIMAFDLSYIQFAEKLNIPHVNFVLHDQIENIHDNQISTMLLDIVKDINCQYIIPILRDKVPDDIDIEKYQILTLSTDDKLFRIRNPS